MAKPTFLGIGVPRAGTTWLHQILDSHPHIYVPQRRKEIHYFDLYYGRGADWYSRFFPTDEYSTKYKAIGEITPHYYYCGGCPERISRVPSINKLLLILRNPVDRAFSFYVHKCRATGIRITFENFLKDFPEDVVEQGFYSKYLQRFLQYFSYDQLLVLIQEQAIKDVNYLKYQIGDFLNVDSELFPPHSGTKRVNQSQTVKHGTAFALAANLVSKLQGTSLDGMVDSGVHTAKQLGILKLFGIGDPLPVMSANTHSWLSEIFVSEISTLEKMLEINLSIWTSQVNNSDQSQ